jgi:type IV secretory pathway VirB4 component
VPNQTTKNLVEIVDIKENVVFLKDTSLRMILEVSSMNFELRSEEEQEAILQQFKQFLNSIDFPLQICIHSRKYDMSEYVKFAQEATATLDNELLKIQAAEYLRFIKELSELSNIMSKKFYVVVPFYIGDTGSKTSMIDGLKNLFKPSTKIISNITDDQFNTYKTQLSQRTDLVYDGLVGVGLKSRVLEGDELRNIFISVYNPDQNKV